MIDLEYLGWDWFHATEDLMNLEYYCQNGPYCDRYCPYENECWMAYETYGRFHAQEWVEHYFIMIYSEGE